MPGLLLPARSLGGATRLLWAHLVRSLVEVLVDVSPGPVRLPCPDLASLLDALLKDGVELAVTGPDGAPLWVGPSGLTAVLAPPLDWDDLVSRFDLPSSFWYDPARDALWAGLGGGVLYGSGGALAPWSVLRAAPGALPAAAPGAAEPLAPEGSSEPVVRPRPRQRVVDPDRGPLWVLGILSLLVCVWSLVGGVSYALGADLVAARVDSTYFDDGDYESALVYEFAGESRTVVLPAVWVEDEVGSYRTLLVHPDSPEEPVTFTQVLLYPLYPLGSAWLFVWVVRSRRSANRARRSRSR